MSIACLIGRHGSGKSTIGRQLRAHGFRHISVGVLRRLAQNGTFPSDVPFSLMMMLKRVRAGQPLPDDVAAKLLGYAHETKHCVIDGFPACPRHIDMLPADSPIVYVWAPKPLLETRLAERAQNTVRAWTPGRHSEREAMLAEVAMRARQTGRLLWAANTGLLDDLDDIAAQLAKKIKG